ncbi:hypothetical protein HMPREF9372_0816 [Sporosarcina newyorkensis 2681]|uniref:Uncharacterized protein n=1 Tax=Sporosarcina newyorkensis 2681 TaxID=1027292 RepID=F9DPT6_9BACL|nr:hypothetical protein HMPREF9372_0816 [Sporosarcina newyorkensis 2681]
MAPAMSQSGRTPVCLIAPPTACKAPAFSKWKLLGISFEHSTHYFFHTSEAATAGSAVAVRQLAVFASWLLAGGNPQTAKRRRCTTLYLVWTHNLVERRDNKKSNFTELTSAFAAGAFV